MPSCSNYFPKPQSVLCVVAVTWAFVAGCADDSVPLDAVRLPPGFVIEIFVDRVPNARAMAFGDAGTLFVGSRNAGNVYAVEFRGPKRKPRVRTLLRNLRQPTGVAFRNGALYVAEVHQIVRFDDVENRLGNLPDPVTVTTLPDNPKHSWRYLGFGPDDKLYIPLGAPCNVCDEPEFGVIKRMNADGTDSEVVARGIRNTIGFTWHPESQALVFTDNGRDRLGNDIPLDELNMVTAPGQHFGFPFCHSGTIQDPDFGQLGSCAESIPPLQNLGPHVAPLGVKFYTGKQFPDEYHGDVFIAEHGSWNRDDPIGYRISRVKMDGDKSLGYEVFIDGWLQDRTPWGRPADILLHEDGSMLVSDDLAGIIYRISYDASTENAQPVTERK